MNPWDHKVMAQQAVAVQVGRAMRELAEVMGEQGERAGEEPRRIVAQAERQLEAWKAALEWVSRQTP